MSVRRPTTGNILADKALGEVWKQIEDIRNTCPFLDGVLLKNVVLKDSATTEIAHKLGRTYRGFFPVNWPLQTFTTPGIIRPSSTSRSSTHVALFADSWGADITIDLWVF